jgi:hypothetical protein
VLLLAADDEGLAATAAFLGAAFLVFVETDEGIMYVPLVGFLSTSFQMPKPPRIITNTTRMTIWRFDILRAFDRGAELLYDMFIFG